MCWADGDSALMFVRYVVKGGRYGEPCLTAVKYLREVTKLGLKDAKSMLITAHDSWIGVPVLYLDLPAINQLTMLGYEIRLVDAYKQLSEG